MSLFKEYFYHDMTRKYQIIFGSLFQNMQVRRINEAKKTQKMINVPVMHSPKEKFAQRLRGDVDPDYEGDSHGRRRTAMSLPVIAYELTDIMYDGQRKIAKNNYIRHLSGVNSQFANHTFVPAPFTLQFDVSIAASTIDEMHQIIEQIIPAFQPEFNITVRGVEGIDYDVPIDYLGLTSTDSYDGSFEERRQIIWQLSFSMKAYYFSPIRKREIILDVNSSIFELQNDLGLDDATLLDSFNANVNNLTGQWSSQDE